MAELLVDLAPAVEFGWVGRGFLFILLAGLPLLAAFQPELDDVELPPRRRLYASAIAGIWVLAGLAAVMLAIEGIPFARIGLHGVAPLQLSGWTALTTVGVLAVSWLVTRIAAHMGAREARLTYHLMPRDGPERRAFLALAASAGFCEEFAYRGFTLAGLAGWLESGWWAAALSGLAFGVLHGYQGPAGALRAAVMGGVLALPVVAGAGLWPAVAAHFLVNAALGLGLWRWIVPPEQHPAEL